MKAGSWSSILTLYLYGVLGASTVSKLVPLGAVLGTGFGTTPAQFGWLVSLVALPAVILAIPSGLLVDRFGPRRILLGAAFLGVAANLLYFTVKDNPIVAVIPGLQHHAGEFLLHRIGRIRRHVVNANIG